MDAQFEVRVARRVQQNAQIIVIDLVPTDQPLPPWDAGAHVDVNLPNGEVRQYSLCGDPADPQYWRLGIAVDDSGRGGSRWLAHHAAPGATLTVSAPRNHFRYTAAPGPVIFIAGGIGITPLLPMIRRAEQEGRAWRLHYIGRSRDQMGFLPELSPHGDKVVLYPRCDVPRPTPSDMLPADAGANVYCCGPTTLMADIEAFATNRPDLRVHMEYFAPRSTAADPPGLASFEVEFAYSGHKVCITEGQTILEAAEALGIEVTASCREGTCGSCETPIVSGCAAHRDSILSAEERRSNRAMMICVSRAMTPVLVLDL